MHRNCTVTVQYINHLTTLMRLNWTMLSTFTSTMVKLVTWSARQFLTRFMVIVTTVTMASIMSTTLWLFMTWTRSSAALWYCSWNLCRQFSLKSLNDIKLQKRHWIFTVIIQIQSLHVRNITAAYPILCLSELARYFLLHYSFFIYSAVKAATLINKIRLYAGCCSWHL